MVDSKENDKFDLGVKGLRYLYELQFFLDACGIKPVREFLLYVLSQQLTFI